MHNQILLVLCLFLSLLQIPTQLSAAELSNAQKLEFFEKHVRPVLIEKCYSCHSAKKQWAELRLDSRAAILKGGESGPAIVLGKPAESLLVLAIQHSDEASEMPPEADKLSEKNISNIARWIKMGSPWTPSDTPQEIDYFDQAKIHWAFQPVKKPDVPQLPKGFRKRNAIDHFIARKLSAAGLKQSPVAEPHTLLRRLSYDLTGLPTDFKMLESFEQQPTEEHYTQQINRLLASKTFGQKWGRYWLDLARYADTKGYVFQEERRYPFAYTYRDYVIESFNDDLPYDQFIREQLAADLLPEKRNQKSLAALGFLTVGPRFLNRVQDIYDDRIDVTIRGLQGLTLACARCHDHKYDPLNSADYYALYGVFDSSTEPKQLPQIGEAADKKAAQKYSAKLKELEKAVEVSDEKAANKINKEIHDHFENYLLDLVKKTGHKTGSYDLKGLYQTRNAVRSQWTRYLLSRPVKDPVWGPLVQLAKLKDAQFESKGNAILKAITQDADSNKLEVNSILVTKLKQKQPTNLFDVVKIYGELYREALVDFSQKPQSERKAWEEVKKAFSDPLAPGSLTKDTVVAVYNAQERSIQRNLKKKIAALMVSSPGSPPRAMVLADKPRPTTPYIFKRGNRALRGDKVPRRFLEVLSSDKNASFSKKASGRYELALAIANPENPLTARVYVNRVWMQLVGKPLVDNTSDFGLRTPPPTHPELLDYLCAEFVAHNWSTKWLVREIVESETYRQSSLANDTSLQADHANQLVWRMNRKRKTFEAMRDSMLDCANLLNTNLNGRPEPLEGKKPTHRRAIYGFIDRNNVSQLLRTFDVAGPSSSVSKRPTTTVPQQALFGMNSPFVISIAKAIADSIDKDHTGYAVDELYQRTVRRNPDPQETKWAVDFVESDPNNKNVWQNLAQALLLSNEFMFID